MKEAYLVLENGQTFKGVRFGAEKEVRAQLVFHTGMLGYLEILTDPGYDGQMVAGTFPLTGNYGFIGEDLESDRAHVSAFVVRRISDTPSNFRCEGILEDYLKAQGVAGLSGVDTRQITRILREEGSMGAAIVDELPEDMDAFTKSLADLPDAGDALKVSCQKAFALGEGEKHAVVWDVGCLKSQIKALTERGLKVTVAPACAKAEEILALNPDGVLLSGGPGNPEKYQDVIAEIKKVTAAGIPMLGVGLGHALLALSQGAQIEKLKFGHHGANQTVRRLTDGKLFTTNQNHGFAVKEDTLQGGHISYRNLNDMSDEGVEYDNIPAFSVQFQPDGDRGAHGTAFVFDQFVERMEG